MKELDGKCWCCGVVVPMGIDTYDQRFGFYTCKDHAHVPPAQHTDYKRGYKGA